jgi:hypothetical protein
MIRMVLSDKILDRSTFRPAFWACLDKDIRHPLYPGQFSPEKGNTIRPVEKSIERAMVIIAVSYSKLGCPLHVCAAV